MKEEISTIVINSTIKCEEQIAKWVFRNPIMHKHAKSLLTRPLSAAGPCA
jgi:hypothetical protein